MIAGKLGLNSRTYPEYSFQNKLGGVNNPALNNVNSCYGLPNLAKDTVSFTSDSLSNKNAAACLRAELNKTKEQQGLIGKAWDGIKNLFKMKAGSSNVEKMISKLENGEITADVAKQALNKYQDGQKTCVDVVGDMVSGIVAVGAFALAVPTGGTSLAIGFGLATATGIGTKVLVKGGDALLAGREYTGRDLLYDSATGAINGLLAPVTNGIGASVTKTIGAKLGLTVVKETGEEIAEQTVKQGLKAGVKSLITQQGVDVIGGTIGKRALALGTGMAVDGALGGAGDNMIRAALDGEDMKGIAQAGINGALGGAVMAPVIGGGFRMTGKAGRAINNNITTRKVLPNGTATTFKQGSAGDCAVLSTVDGLMNNPQTQIKIKKAITKSIGGDYNVKIGNQTVRVAKEQLRDEILSDTTGVKLFELAYKQLNGSLDGDFADVVAKQFGLNPIHIANDGISDEMLDKLAKQTDSVLSFGTKIDTDGAISTEGANHYFSIRKIDPETKNVTLVNPYDTSKTFNMTYDEIKSSGVSIDGGSLSETDLPNVLRNADDITFRGKKSDLSCGYNIDEYENAILKELNNAFGGTKYTRETFEEVLSKNIKDTNFNFDSLLFLLNKNGIQPEEFISFLDGNEANIVSAIRALCVYSPIKKHSFFDGFDLSLKQVSQIYKNLSDGNFDAIVDVLDECNSELAAKYIDTGIFDDTASFIQMQTNLLKDVSAIGNPKNFITVKINGKETKLYTGSLTNGIKGSFNLNNLSQEELSDLLKSNLLTEYVLENDNLYKFLEGKTKKAKFTPIRYCGSDGKLKGSNFDFSVQYNLDDLRHKFLKGEKLTSHETHALTDFMSELAEKNIEFADALRNSENLKNAGTDLKKISQLVGCIKSDVKKYNIDESMISEHAYMRIIDRDMLYVINKKTGKLTKITELFPKFIKAAKQSRESIDDYDVRMIIKDGKIDTFIYNK